MKHTEKTRLRIKKDKRVIPKVFKSTFGGYYILGTDIFTQQQLANAYAEQNKNDQLNPS
jgi:hypothetical protein